MKPKTIVNKLNAIILYFSSFYLIVFAQLIQLYANAAYRVIDVGEDISGIRLGNWHFKSNFHGNELIRFWIVRYLTLSKLEILREVDWMADSTMKSTTSNGSIKEEQRQQIPVRLIDSRKIKFHAVENRFSRYWATPFCWNLSKRVR